MLTFMPDVGMGYVSLDLYTLFECFLAWPSLHVHPLTFLDYLAFLYKHVFLCTCDKGFVKESARLYQGSILWRITTSRMFTNRQKAGGKTGELRTGFSM